MAKKVKAATIADRAKRAGLKQWGGYDAQLARQDGRCCICCARPKNRRLHVDHDHKTGECRGLLCWTCNATIGRAYDQPRRLMFAAYYLKYGWKFVMAYRLEIDRLHAEDPNPL